MHDSRVFTSVFRNTIKKYDAIKYIAIDAGYKTPEIAKEIIDNNVIPAMPYKRPMTKKGFFRKYEYVYDEHFDCYICPNNKILTYSTTNRDGYKEYKSNAMECKKCQYLHKCTESKNTTKIVTRHIFQNYLDEAEHLRHRKDVKEVYGQRSTTIERCFADLKEKHGGRYTNYRGIARMKVEALLMSACMNMKKIALWSC